MKYIVQVTDGFQVIEEEVHARDRTALIDYIEELMHETDCSSAEVWYAEDSRNRGKHAFSYEV